MLIFVVWTCKFEEKTNRDTENWLVEDSDYRCTVKESTDSVKFHCSCRLQCHPECK